MLVIPKSQLASPLRIIISLGPKHAVEGIELGLRACIKTETVFEVKSPLDEIGVVENAGLNAIKPVGELTLSVEYENNIFVELSGVSILTRERREDVQENAPKDKPSCFTGEGTVTLSVRSF